MTKPLKILVVIIGIGLTYGVIWNVTVYIAVRSKPLGKFLVDTHFRLFSCNSSKSGCYELRPLPKVLQGKKIVFNSNTNVEFDPFKTRDDFSDLDILGFLDTNPHEFDGNLVDPVLRERGNLAEREYCIIRAVYHYNCSYCIDSSDYAYIVLEDSKGNRFSSLLNDMDSSVSPARDIPWDEQFPYALDKGGELGVLKDIN